MTTNFTVDSGGNWRLYTNTLPADCEVFGTVSSEDNGTGALVKIKATGKYAQVNAGVIKNLDGRSIAAVLGLSGRPKIISKGRAVNVFLDDITIQRAAELGSGNLSEGIRLAIRSIK